MANSYATQIMNVIKGHARAEPEDFVRFFHDFVTVPIDDTTGKQTLFAETADAGATGTTGPLDGKGGWLQVFCDGDDNDEAYLSSGSEAYIFNTSDKVVFEARVKHTAGSTDGKGSFILGLSDTVGANSITDAGSIMASFDGAVFLKGEDDNIDFITSNASTQVRNEVQTWADGSTHRLGFVYDPADGTTGKVIPTVDGFAATDSNGDAIIHDLTISGLQEMHILLGVKTHEANEQSLEVDWLEAIQER